MVEEGAVDFYKQLGISRIMTGWSKFSSGAIGGDAENYANAHGAKSATLESGSHFEKRSNDVAYRSVVSVLSLLGMIDGAQTPARTASGDRGRICCRAQGVRRLPLRGRGGQFSVHREGPYVCHPERTAADCQRGQLSPYPDEAGGHAPSRGGVLPGSQDRHRLSTILSGSISPTVRDRSIVRRQRSFGIVVAAGRLRLSIGTAVDRAPPATQPLNQMLLDGIPQPYRRCRNILRSNISMRRSRPRSDVPKRRVAGRLSQHY